VCILLTKTICKDGQCEGQWYGVTRG
jgi:hypothetical protein